MFIRPAAKRIFLLPLFVVALAISALGQSNKATIVGTTKDPNDALVTGAKVTVINNATGVVREADSGEDGTFTITNLEPGAYTVTVNASGFQTVTYENVQVETNARLPLDVKFSTITGGTGSVTVTADTAPLTESETSVRGDVISGRQVTDLPIPKEISPCWRHCLQVLPVLILACSVAAAISYRAVADKTTLNQLASVSLAAQSW